MEHHDLQIYRSTYGLLETIAHTVKQMRRDFKFTLGEKLNDNGIECILLISKANQTKSSNSRVKYLTRIIDRFETIQILTRLSKDLKIITIKHYSKIIEEVDDCLSQSKKWKKYTDKYGNK